MMKPLDRDALRYVAARMCEQHARNARALSFSDDLDAALGDYPRIGVSIWRNGSPQVAAGAVIPHPGHASTFLYGTDQWPQCILETSRFFRHHLRPALAKAGVRRVTVFAPADDPTGDRWKQMLGCEREAVLRKYDKFGRDWAIYVTFLAS